MKPIAASIAISLFVAGCGPSFPTIDSSALAEAVAQVRTQTVKICNYFPSDSTLVSILTASHPVVETAVNIARQICDAVTAAVPPLTPTQMQAPRAGDENQCHAMVRGVCIEGKFLTTEKHGAVDGYPDEPDSKETAP